MLQNIVRTTVRYYARKILLALFVLLILFTFITATLTVALMHAYRTVLLAGVSPAAVWAVIFILLLGIIWALRRDIRRARLKQQLVVEKTINDYHSLTTDSVKGVILAFAEGWMNPQDNYKPKGDIHEK